MIAIGFISAYMISDYRGKKRNMNADINYGIFWCSVIGGALGSRLLYYLGSIPSIIKDPSILWDFQTGWVVYGGIIGGVLLSWAYCHIKKVTFVDYADLVLPAVAFAQGCGRIGCFFAGCCYGRETTSPVHIRYWMSEIAPNHVDLVPTQIYSSIGDFAIAFLLFAYAKREPAKGRVVAGYCLLYSVGRYIIEFFRDDYRGEIGPLSTSQLISIVIFITGVVIYVLAGKKEQLKLGRV
jgi:phosphatidylglycerol:prolipoprotein diacylglycerol transferase